MPGQTVPQHDAGAGAYGSLPPDDPWLQGNDAQGTHHDGTGN